MLEEDQNDAASRENDIFNNQKRVLESATFVDSWDG